MSRCPRPTPYPTRPVVTGRKAMAMRRVAAGQDAVTAARATRLSVEEVRTMLADGSVGRVLATWRDLLSLADTVRLHLVRFLSMFVVLEAIEEREPRICIWLFHESQRGRDPFEVLARSVVRMLTRAPREASGWLPPAPVGPRECDPMSDGYAARARLRILAQLRMRVIEEIASRRADLLEDLGHDPVKPAPASLDWVPGLDLPPMPMDAARTPVPEPRAGP
ncbi:MAG: hypothetical protein U1E45_06485 [Geminicoccaceae bacterium]